MRVEMKKNEVLSMLKKHRAELVQRCERRMSNCYFDESGALERLCIRLMELDIVIHKIEEML